MELSSYFEDFLPVISPSEAQRKTMVKEHTKLRERLMDDPILKLVLLSTFIQGSQRRWTANRGSVQHPCDVDIVAVTNCPRNSKTAAEVHNLFIPFLERHYPGQYEPQNRSWCITTDPEVTMDLVPTSEPDSVKLKEAVGTRSLRDWEPDGTPGIKQALGLQTLTEAALAQAERDKDWDKTEPLWIPDKELRVWEKTHPLFLIGWSAAKNLACNGRYSQVVKVIKWWRRHMAPLPKYPKGYPLEHIIGDCCPDGIKTVAEGVTRTFEEIARRYAESATQRKVPFLAARGVTDPQVDVMRRITEEDFAGFHAHVMTAARLARAAFDSSDVTEMPAFGGAF